MGTALHSSEAMAHNAAARSTAKETTALGTAVAFLAGFVVASFAVQVVASAPRTNGDIVVPHQATLWSTLGQN